MHDVDDVCDDVDDVDDVHVHDVEYVNDVRDVSLHSHCSGFGSEGKVTFLQFGNFWWRRFLAAS